MLAAFKFSTASWQSSQVHPNCSRNSWQPSHDLFLHLHSLVFCKLSWLHSFLLSLLFPCFMSLMLLMQCNLIGPIWSLQGLSVCWQRFPGLSFLCDWNLQGRQLCNKLSLDSIIVWHSTSTLYMISYITFLKMICHNVCNYTEQKWNRQFTSPSMVKNGLGTGLITI